MNDTDRATCAALAGLLRAAAVLAVWGLALAVIAALALVLAWVPVFPPRTLPAVSTVAFGGVLVLAVLERYVAFRLRFDAALFDALAQGRISALDTLDGALARLGLRRNVPSTPRSLADRVLGTRRLLLLHGLVVAGQTVFFVIVLCTLNLT